MWGPDEERLVRAYFVIIESSPEEQKQALRERIARQLRGECPAERPEMSEEVSFGEDGGRTAGGQGA